jgi:hypothetical protein
MNQVGDDSLAESMSLLKEKFMSRNTNRLSVMATFILACSFGPSPARAQNTACRYSVASLQGTYAVVLTYGANVAAGQQIEQLDGKGNVTRTGPINQPVPGSTTGERSVSPVTSVGTYTVNCDGTGVVTRVVTQANGASANTVDDIMITTAEKNNGVWIATMISDMQRTPSSVVPGGIFVTRVHTRLPSPLPVP